MKFKYICFYFIFTILSMGYVHAQTDLDADTIIQRSNLASMYAGQDGRAETLMTIIDNKGRKQIRQFVILRRDREEGGDQDFFVIFSRPADVRDTIFLVSKKVDAEDDRWPYLPNLDLVKRIAAGDKRTSFVGSQFFYEDVSGRRPDEDHHHLVDTTETHFIIDNTPKNTASVEFQSYRLWINKQNYLPQRADYFDTQGEVYRQIEALNIEEIQGYPTITKMKVSDLRSGGSTTNEMRFIQYDIGLPEEIFSERSLRHPPRQWLKRPKK
ncbi:MAG TPA: outer membrane lipoprotein-sorting protein [Gammaproteobacteria bacterium]|nr:outer membrane lipoprotein-sorting protein [Gammaproteobacteria bacterium]